MTDAELLAHVSQQGQGRTNLRSLLRELRARTAEEREAVESGVGRLVGRGELLALRNGHFQATSVSRDFVAGRVSVHRDGYGFLVPDAPVAGMSGDVFLGRDALGGAMHGDRAIARITFRRPDGRQEGEIFQILKRAHTEVVGEFRITKRGLFVAPQDARLTEWIAIPEDAAIPAVDENPDRIGTKPVHVESPADMDGMIVNAVIESYDEHPVGRVVEILGWPGDFGIDVEIIIRKHHLPHHFPPEVIAEAKAVPDHIEAGEIGGRRDFRELPIVTIDGETARDFDDAVLVEKLDNGNFALQVHIADVSYYVRPGSAIDREAQMRGTSVYFPDRAVPMLPFELSTNICSLVPHQDRLVLSALMEFDHEGRPVAYEFCRGVIRSAERMTYTGVFRILQEEKQPRFERMRELAEILMRKRYQRGSIDFDLPEALIEFNPEGEMTGVGRGDRTIANRIIEEFMLAANEAVAEHLEQTGRPSIYRIHEQPDPRRVMEFEDVAAQFGYSLGVGAIPVSRHRYQEKRRDGKKAHKEVVLPGEIKVPSRAYQKLVAKIEGKPEERILSYLMLRSLRQAKYSATNSGHYALAATHYTHFTSPIRRYPDLIVHRLMAAAFDGTTYSNEAELRVIAEDCSMTERRAAEAERELVEWKKAKFMEDHIGEEFDAMIISTAKFGAFVELLEMFVEGLVPVEALPGDRYTYHENVRKIIGQRTRREFSIGDKVRVILDRVDPIERKLTFGIVEAPRAGKPRGAGKPRSPKGKRR